MKKIFILLVLVFLVTGCSFSKETNLEKLVDEVITGNENLTNTYFSGYKFYLPGEAILTKKLGYNSIIRYKENNIYLYVDVISYYHKIKNTYENNDEVYFSKVLDNGYINVLKESEDKYYINIKYNYGKIEAYSNERNLNGTITSSLTILKTLKFNDIVIESLIGENKIEYKEEKFDIFKSERNEEDGYLDIIDDNYDGENDDEILVDDDKIIIEAEESLSNY